MRVIKDIEELKGSKISSVSIGNFDGLHLGHRAIIKRLKSSASNLVITFEPHPREILSQKKSGFIITTKEEKLALFEKLGIDNLLILKFDRKLLQMPASDFIRWLLVDHIKPEEIVIGYNHRFGQGASGNFELLVHIGAQFEFRVIRVPPVFVEGFPVSSTWIRNTLTKGDVKLASKLLGRPYSIQSYVIPGKKRGTALGYPTANLESSFQKLIPRNGVYAVRVTLSHPTSQVGNHKLKPRTSYRKLSGMMSVGEKPTFPDSPEFGIEVHIFDFKGDLLNQSIKVEFMKYLRPNRPFKSPEALKTQLKLDETIVRRILGTRKILT